MALMGNLDGLLAILSLLHSDFLEFSCDFFISTLFSFGFDLPVVFLRLIIGRCYFADGLNGVINKLC